jgi:hypothetical protein
MGQIETKNEDNVNNKVDDKETDEKKASNDVKIQMQNNSDCKENKDSGLEYEEIEKEDENKNADACDFGCESTQILNYFFFPFREKVYKFLTKKF